MKILIHIVLILVCQTAIVYAGETLNYNIHQQYVTPRSLGAGGTFSGMDDYHVMFYNPAGLGQLQQKDFDLGIAAATSQATVDFTKDISDISKSTASESDKIQNMSDFLEKHEGKVFAGRLPKIEFLYTRPKWGFAFIPMDVSLALMPNKLAGPAADVTAYQDTTIAFGFGKAHKQKRFSWGVVAKAIYRANVDKSLLALELVNDSDVVRDSDYKEGLTADLDLGVAYAPWKNNKKAKYFNPTFQAVVRNAVDAGFFGNYHVYNDHSEKPDNLQRRIDVGTLIEIGTNQSFAPRLMIDVRDILHEYFSIKKGIHLGSEIKYKVGRGLFGSIQGGYSQGYWTAGLGIQTYFFKVEIASFAEEFGTKSETKTDRQTIAQINFNF